MPRLNGRKAATTGKKERSGGLRCVATYTYIIDQTDKYMNKIYKTSVYY